MLHHLLSYALLAATTACVTSGSSEPSGPREQRGELPARGPAIAEAAPPEALSGEARRLLTARMRRHGAQMNTLVSSVITLDWAAVQRASVQLIEEPAIAPPLPDEADSFNTQLPASFFAHQDRLLAAVRELRAAAERKSDHEAKAAFNGVAAACIDCHSAYLHEPTRPTLFDSAPRLR